MAVFLILITAWPLVFLAECTTAAVPLAALVGVEKIGRRPWGSPARRRRCAPALTARAADAAIGGVGRADDRLRGEDLVVVRLELGDEVAAVDAVARGERPVELAVEMVLGEVLDRGVSVGRVADREEVEATLDDLRRR